MHEVVSEIFVRYLLFNGGLKKTGLNRTSNHEKCDKYC